MYHVQRIDTQTENIYDYNDKNNNYFFGKREEQVMFGLVLFFVFRFSYMLNCPHVNFGFQFNFGQIRDDDDDNRQSQFS